MRHVETRRNSYCGALSLGLPRFRHLLRCYHKGTITTVKDWTITSQFYWVTGLPVSTGIYQIRGIIIRLGWNLETNMESHFYQIALTNCSKIWAPLCRLRGNTAAPHTPPPTTHPHTPSHTSTSPPCVQTVLPDYFHISLWEQCFRSTVNSRLLKYYHPKCSSTSRWVSSAPTWRP